MAAEYTVTTGLVSLAASLTRVACSLATNTTVQIPIISFDVSFDSVATGAGSVPIRVQLCRTSTVSSVTGAAQVPVTWNSLFHASVTTARINDTTPGTLTAVVKEWFVSPTSGLVYQFPLGREITIPHSSFFELRLVSQAGMTTCNYICNLDFEE